MRVRCWDNVNQRMGECLTVSLCDGRIIGAEVDFGGSASYPVIDGEFMLYTGQDDKNGKPIYAWDILHCGDSEDSEEYEGPVCVQWSKHRAAWGFDNGDTFSDYHMEEFEKIGNRWETPELLECTG